MRQSGDAPYRTDDGNLILDDAARLHRRPPRPGLHAQLKSLCGVIETGLFCIEADHALVGQFGTVTDAAVQALAAAAPRLLFRIPDSFLHTLLILALMGRYDAPHPAARHD